MISEILGLLAKWLVNSLALFAADYLVGGIIIYDFWSGLAAAALLGADVAAVRVRLGRRGLPIGLPSLVAGRLRALGSLVYYLSYHLVRYYASLLILLALIVPQFWVLFVGVLGCAAGVDHAVRKPQLPFVRFAGIYLLEQVAYGAGVFWGCLRGRTFSSYRVVILRQMELPA